MPTLNLPYLPTRQRTAREQQAAGVTLPYWVEDLDGPNNHHLRLTILQLDDIDRLVLWCRKYAAEYLTNTCDNRRTLDYPVTNRERCAFIRHCLLNRTEMNADKVAGYHGSYDSTLFRIRRSGVNTDAKQLTYKCHVAELIAEHYPQLAIETAYWLWQCEMKLQRNQPIINLFDQPAHAGLSGDQPAQPQGATP